MSPAQSIPSSSSHLFPSTIDTTLLSILASKGLHPSSIASTNLPDHTRVGHETSFPLTIDLGAPANEMSTGMYAVMMCAMPGETEGSPTIQTIEIGPGRPLAQVFREMTGEELPKGCMIAVPSHKMAEEIKQFTDGATLFVHEPFSNQTGTPEAEEQRWRDLFEGVLEIVGIYTAVGIVAFICVAGCCVYPVSRRLRQEPGGEADREEARGFELSTLLSPADSETSGGAAPTSQQTADPDRRRTLDPFGVEAERLANAVSQRSIKDGEDGTENRPIEPLLPKD